MPAMEGEGQAIWGSSGVKGGEGYSGRRRRRDDEEDEEDEETRLLREVEQEGYEEYVPLKKRREVEERELRNEIRQDGEDMPTETGEPEDGKDVAPPKRVRSNTKELQANESNNESLLRQAFERKKEEGEPSEIDQQAKEEEEILKTVVAEGGTGTLAGAQDKARGIQYTEPMATGWSPPRRYREMSEEERHSVRERENISVQGEDIPAPIPSFRQMRLPKPILKQLEQKKITKPTPIQMQGLPTVLSGRDMIGVAFTGSGKTLVFCIPMIALSLHNERAMPIERGEGPIGLVVCPSRELAGQTHGVVQSFLQAMRDEGEPELRSALCVGGVSPKEQLALIGQGVHIVVATPGRLKDFLGKAKMGLDCCRYLCLDEADRMLDLGFEEDIKEVCTYFKAQRQTVLFSATMPQKIRSFAEASLVKPVVVNVSRAGAASLDVIQEVEYVKEEEKLPYLLECLQKTPPPVLIFAENKSDVDNVHEYLLLKGVDAVAVHGSKSQEERASAVQDFKAGKKDVLVATDVASKGLDFPDIQHVVNYDMPEEIENYVHRIGRTGRCGRTGIATTFINKNQSEHVLLDLKLQLKEADQRIPPALSMLDDPTERVSAAEDKTGVKGCAYCGGLGHRVTDCPKLQQYKEQRLREQGRKDPFSGGGFSAEL